MHIKAKQVAFLGVLAAMVIVFIILASIIETNTLFLLAAAAYMVGIAIREFGVKMGSSFFVACVLLGFLLAPNKIYVLTYTGLSLYIVWNEASYIILSKMSFQKYKSAFFLLTKFVFFNLLYIPVLFVFSNLIFPKAFSPNVLFLLILGGQLGWIIYDKAYEYFQGSVWGKLRERIGLLH